MLKGGLFIFAILATIIYLIYLVYSKNKSYIKYSLALLVILIGSYNILQQGQNDYTHSITLAFKNNKQIMCDEIKITKKDFNIVTATGIFLGKQKSSYKGYVIPLETCEIVK